MKSTIGLLTIIAVALWSVWPMIITPNRVADYGKDGMYLAAVQLNWHKKISDYIRHVIDPGMNLFDGYFFYSERNSLAYSDLLFVTSLMTYWITKLSNNPTAVNGIALVLWQVFTLVVSYGVFAKIAKSVWGGLIGAIGFGLSQIRFEYQVHLHTWNMTLWLLGYWLFSQKKYFLSAVFLGLQMWESPLGTYFGLMAIIVHLINYQFSVKLLIKNLIIFGTVFMIVAFLPMKAYWEVSQYYHYVRTIKEAAHHAISLNSLGSFGSVGLFTLFIFALAKISFKFKFLITLILVSYVLALGPVLKWDNKTVKIGRVIPIPLPYAIAYYVVPGWQAFRVPSRWLVVMGWGMGGVIAMAFNNALFNPPLKFKRGTLGGVRKKVGIVGCLAVAVLGGTRVIKYVDLPQEIPSEYTVNREVLEFRPMGSEEQEIERMYYTILAGKKTMNGYSGFVPPERVKLLNEK